MESIIGLTLGNYSLIRKIGEGSFASVWCAIHRVLKKNVAVKIIEKQRDMQQLKMVRREIDIMRKLDHQFIVQLFEVFEDDTHIFMVMEYLPKGTIKDSILFEGSIKESDARKYFVQVVIALKYLHQMGIIHRDIKAENIMLDENNNIRITDFGLSNEISLSQTACGTPAYAAPEVILRKSYNEKLDIWSIGILLYMMLTSNYPFDDPSVPGLLRKIIHADIDFPDFISEIAKDLILLLLEKNQEKRISINEILLHPWCLVDGPLPDIQQRSNDFIDFSVAKSVSMFQISYDHLIDKLENGIEDKDTIIYKIARIDKRVAEMKGITKTINEKTALPPLNVTKSIRLTNKIGRQKQTERFNILAAPSFRRKFVGLSCRLV